MAVEGTFVLADIGGYTSFLSGVGIEHAKEITSHLFNSLRKCNRELFRPRGALFVKRQLRKDMAGLKAFCEEKAKVA